MFYTIYETTNIINSKKYIGKHVTSDLNDGYIGSGTIIGRAIEKYGKDNFTKKILFVYDNEEQMNAKEIELITPDIVLSEQYYNIAYGGKGGAIVLKPDHPLYSSTCKKISIAQQQRLQSMSLITAENHKLRRVGMYGKTQSQYQREVVSKLMKGKPKSNEQIAKQKLALSKKFNDPNYIHPNKNKPKIKLTCPYCSKTIGGVSNYNRYHGDNCKKVST